MRILNPIIKYQEHTDKRETPTNQENNIKNTIATTDIVNIPELFIPFFGKNVVKYFEEALPQIDNTIKIAIKRKARPRAHKKETCFFSRTPQGGQVSPEEWSA